MALLAVVGLASACADTSGPEAAPDAGGTWEGTLTHPSYDGGALRLTLIDANGALSGSYRLILSKRVGGRASVEQSSGQVTGSSTGGRLRLLLPRSDGEQWLLDGVLTGSRAQGPWSTARGVRGNFNVSR
jgi:hypothetical protein